jgi:hypothetical protein
MKVFLAGSSRATRPRGGAPAMIRRLEIVQAIVIRPCSGREGRQQYQLNPVAILTWLRRIDTMKSPQGTGCRECFHRRRQVNLYYEDTLMG